MSNASEELAAAVRRLLTDRGPLSQEDLFDGLVAAGVDMGPDPEDALFDTLERNSGPLMELDDDRWAWLPALLDGRVFTHRLTTPEAELDVLGWADDLMPLSMLTVIPEFLRLSDGAPIADALAGFDDDDLAARGVPEDFGDGEGVVLLPPGRFAAIGLRAGDLVGMRVTAKGFELSRVDEVSASGFPTALTAALGRNAGEPVMLDAEVWTSCADDPALFREPTHPLTELLAIAGLGLDHAAVAPAGFDFEAWRAGKQAQRLAAKYRLDADEAQAVVTLKRLCGFCRGLLEQALGKGEFGKAEFDSLVAHYAAPDDPERMPVRVALEYVAEPIVASAVLDETTAVHPDQAAALGLFAESIEPMAPRSSRPALRWLRGKAHERRGEIDSAEAVFESALSLDPSCPLNLTSLARYAADRGDAERAISLLRRAGIPDGHELIELLQQYVPAARIGLGRNERCWCGSGRKYKVCHLNREQLPLEERAAWLYQKATFDLSEAEFASLLVECAQARAAYSADPDAVDAALYDDPFVTDVVLFEGGAFEDFLTLRGHLLPDDERLMARQWLLTERSLHEVLDVRPGEGMTMRDARTGDVVEVRERSASRQVKPGEFYCGRIVSTGEIMQSFGGLEPVALNQREELIALLDDEPDPVELVEYLSRRLAPVRMTNTEREPLLLCDATLAVGDPDALAAALDAAYDRLDDEDDGVRVWVEYVVTHGMQRIRAQLELRGDQLHVNANSANRFERVLAAVRALDPSVMVVSETREPAGSPDDIARLSAQHPPTGAVLDPRSPEIAAVLEQAVRQYEQAWLDEPIPALSGRTPRECAADPTRRDDLIRLLDTFPDRDEPGAMSPARLRAALGLRE